MLYDPGCRLVLAAMKEWGQTEISGRAYNKRIGEYLRAIGLEENDETAWCGAFMYFIAQGCNVERPSIGIAPSAKSWLRVGTPVAAPMFGDVVVLHRGDSSTWMGHVGLYIAPCAKDKIWVLGGNQSNSVNVEAFDQSKVAGYRRLLSLTAIH